MSKEKSQKKINFEEAADLIKKNEVIDITQLDFSVNFEHRNYLDTYAESDFSTQCENDYRIYETNTLLHLAIQAGNANMARELLNHGASLTIPIKTIYVRTHRGLKSTSYPNSLSPQYDETESIEVKSEKTTWDLVIKKNNPGILIEIIKFREKQDISELISGVADIKITSATTNSGTGSNLKLYSFSNKSDAEQAENAFQTHVNDRFFRRNKLNKGLKPNGKADVLVKNIEGILKLKSENKIRDDQLKHEANNKTINFYIKNHVALDDFSARSIIFALTHLLNKYGHIPTLVFKIGNNNILCASNPTKNQKGNVNIQAINPDGTIKFLPSVYGDGNGSSKYSMADRLKKITQSPNNNILELMKSKSRKASSFSQEIANKDDAFFLDQLNFLHSIIEVARRGYYKDSISDLDKLPVGISQARTYQLLIDKQINIDHAYGLDDKEEFYTSQKILKSYDHKKKTPTKTSPKDEHKSPYGAATGKDLEKNSKEVKEKIARINAKYNERYSTSSSSTSFIIEGRNLMRKNLGEQYGSDGESSGEDYSDDDGLNKAFKISSLQFFKPEKTPTGYTLGKQKLALKFVAFSLYKSYKFIDYNPQHDLSINNFLQSIGLRRGSATIKGNNCLLHSYFQNIQNFLQSNYPESGLALLDTDFPSFVQYIRDDIEIKDDMLSANDEEQGTAILHAIQQYLENRFDRHFGFNLEIFFADKDGNVAAIDNSNAIQNGIAVNANAITIPLQVIQVGYNHYEPIFINLPEQQAKLSITS